MQLENLKQPPNQATLMGALKGALDYYRLPTSDAGTYGVSGHAFLINIHDEICPSGPYVWKSDWFLPLVRNLGLELEDLGFFHSASRPAERAEVEAALRAHLDAGRPCSLVNMENQLITGYDEGRFLVARPWNCAPEVTPATLTFGTWAEFGDECHVNFFAFHKREPASEKKAVVDALRSAVGLFRDPGKHSHERYGIGPAAYDNWLGAVEMHGGSHGNWWNATVWAECREMAAAWFEELAVKLPGVAGPALELARTYRDLAGTLARVADKQLTPGEKAPLIAEAKELDTAGVDGIEVLLGRIG